MEVLGHFIAETGLFYASGHNCPVIAANADRPTNKSIRTLRLQLSFPSRQKERDNIGEDGFHSRALDG